MALIKCKECGHTMSDKAAVCPHCGAPIEKKHVDEAQATKVNETAERQPQERQGRGKNVAIVLLSVALFVVVVVLLILLLMDRNTTNATNEDLTNGDDATPERVVEKEEVQAEPSNTINGHEYVDLGLSVKWATCNVGASSPEDYGDYFAWGEIKPKSEYTYENCTTMELKMHNISGNPKYDAARANWGGTWRMPTDDEINELIDKCELIWTKQGKRHGYRITGSNGNSIFLPAAGNADIDRQEDADWGSYWSATASAYEDCADQIEFNNTNLSIYWGNHRCFGFPIRPVSD